MVDIEALINSCPEPYNLYFRELINENKRLEGIILEMRKNDSAMFGVEHPAVISVKSKPIHVVAATTPEVSVESLNPTELLAYQEQKKEKLRKKRGGGLTVQL